MTRLKLRSVAERAVRALLDDWAPDCYGHHPVPHRPDLDDTTCGTCPWRATCIPSTEDQLAKERALRDAATVRQPKCFGDPEKRDPQSRVCTSCRFYQTCGLLAKRRADARARADAPRPDRKPRCFGTPGSYDSQNEECLSCRYHSTCRVIVLNKLRAP